jgi:cytochrome d ubiquinol oxidase subunit II
MSENISSFYLLQHYWWIVISLISGVLVFLLFVQGGQTLIYTIGKNDTDQRLIINSLGRKWEFTFTTLVVFGGAFFASFPLFYTASFGGAYWLWMTILFCFVIQAISYEYRSKPGNIFGKKVYEAFLLINGFGGTFLLGTFVATLFTGSCFFVNLKNITNERMTAVSGWQSPAHGLEALLNWRNVLLGLSVFFLTRSLALLYFMNNIKDENIFVRSKKHLLYNAIPFVLFFLAFLICIFITVGYAYFPDSKLIYLEKYKYFINLIEMPFVGIMFLAGILLVLTGIVISLLKNSTKGIWFSGAGTIITMFTLFLNVGFNNTAFYPSNYDFQSSITIENGSSSQYTLTAMSYVSILVPFVIAYMAYAWKAINNKQIDADEIKGEGHVY